MKSFVVILVLMSTLTAAASTGQGEAPALPQDSYMQRLLNGYENAGAPDFSALDRVLISGRCFLKQKPNKAYAAALLVKYVTSPAGPLDDRQLFLGPAWSQEAVPDYFDDSTYANMRGIKGLFHRTTVDTVQNAVTLSVSTSRFALRQDDKYIYLKATEKSDEPWAACYYFKINR